MFAKRISVLGMVLGCALYLQALPSYRTPFSNDLEARLQTHPMIKENPGMGRLDAMRFYFPNNQVKEEPGFLENFFSGTDTDAQVRAMAFYLFNMYVSTAAYKVDMPGYLTLDYVGVLDGFAKCKDKLDWAEAEKFYDKHKTDIQNWLKTFFEKAKLPAYTPGDGRNEAREKAFVRLLKTADKHGKMPGYRWLGNTYLKGRVRAQDAALLRERLQQSLASGKNQVITFTQGAASLEDFDHPIGPKQNHRERTYRCVNDECNYCSYLFGKQFCEEIATGQRNWGLMRLYKVTAYPVHDEFLTPFSGTRFVQADGTQTPPWRYHTATLVIMNLDGRYTPLVVDKFLAGANPQTIDVWAKHFAGNKVFFEIVPFERSAAVEQAIKTPSSYRGKDVVVDGVTYKPHPVLN